MIDLKGIFRIQYALVLILMFFLPLLYNNKCFAWSSHQDVIIPGVSKSQIIDNLERFVILNCYKFRVKDKKNGRFQIFVKKTDNYGKIFNLDNTFFYKTGNKVHWLFSVEITQLQNDVRIIGYSQGGLAPGRYFNKFLINLKDSGYNVIDKIKTIPQDKSNENCTIISNIPSIDDLEQRTFKKTNSSLILEERLSLLELHYFHKQLLNLSTNARLIAIHNKIQSLEASETKD